MNSPSVLLNMPAAAPVVPVAEAAATSAGAVTGTSAPFDLALAAAQAQVAAGATGCSPQPLSVEQILARLPGVDSGEPAAVIGVADDIDTFDADMAPAKPEAANACDSGAAAILAQMLLGSTQPLDVPQQQTAMAATRPAAARPAARELQTGAAADALVATGTDADAGAVEVLTSAAVALTEPSKELPASEAKSGATAQPSGSSPSAIQAAASALRDADALRDAAPTNNTTPAHARATLREPVGSARWADELGSRLVLMSVRGQQQGSLTLTPEHLGPVEVQISVSRDTAHVWFGAQHADTRTALAEAMPRLREMLASSGLSLGQAGVSEHSPRERFVPAAMAAVGDAQANEAGIQTAAAPAWRRWQPGLVDTYA